MLFNSNRYLLIICCEAVRPAILATAQLLVVRACTLWVKARSSAVTDIADAMLAAWFIYEQRGF